MPEVDSDQLPRRAGEAFGKIVDARPASSVMLLRGDPFEVLMMRRTPKSTFVPGAWIFPGGAVEPFDLDVARRLGGDQELAHRVCAMREMIEEVSIDLEGSVDRSRRSELLAGDFPDVDIAQLGKLIPTSRWVTPEGVPKRFDTWFYLLPVPEETEAVHDEIEGVDHCWIRPAEALAKAKTREMPLVFPTIRNLEAIAGFRSSTELIESRSGVKIEPTRPVLIVENGRTRIELPEQA